MDVPAGLALEIRIRLRPGTLVGQPAQLDVSFPQGNPGLVALLLMQGTAAIARALEQQAVPPGISNGGPLPPSIARG